MSKLGVLICTALIAGCSVREPARSFDLGSMTLGFGFGTSREAAVESLKARGFTLDSSKSSIKIQEVVVFGRRAAAGLRFNIDKLRSVGFELKASDSSTPMFLDSLFNAISEVVGEPSSLTGVAPRGSGLGYIAQWWIPKDTCGYMMANIKEQRYFAIFASGRHMKDMVDSAMKEMDEYIRKNPEYRRELERRLK